MRMTLRERECAVRDCDHEGVFSVLRWLRQPTNLPKPSIYAQGEPIILAYCATHYGQANRYRARMGVSG